MQYYAKHPTVRGQKRWSPCRWLRAQTVPRSRFSESDRTIIAAQGKALALLVTTLHARGVIDMEEFANTLGVFSAVVAEDDPSEGDVLAVWAGIIEDSR